MTVQDKLKQVAESLGVPFVLRIGPWLMWRLTGHHFRPSCMFFLLPGNWTLRMEISVTTRTGCWLS